MALDVLLEPDPKRDALARAVQRRPRWQVARGGWRRAVVQLVYRDDDTGVAFTLDPGESARLNVPRPDFYGREAVGELHRLASALGCSLVVDDEDGLRPVDEHGALAAWRRLNGEAREILGLDPDHAARVPRDRADAWWWWQSGLTARRAELQPESVWLPTLTWLRDATDGEGLRAAVWAEGQAQALPDAEVFLVIESLDSPARVVPADAIADAVGDLVRTRRLQDGTSVRHVPVGADDECRRRVLSAAADVAPFDPERYSPLLLEDLRDDPTP